MAFSIYDCLSLVQIAISRHSSIPTYFSSRSEAGEGSMYEPVLRPRGCCFPSRTSALSMLKDCAKMYGRMNSFFNTYKHVLSQPSSFNSQVSQ